MRRLYDIITLVFATTLAIVLAAMAYERMPKVYHASVLVSDETKEMTIAIGLSQINNADTEKSRLDDPDVYHEILDAPDFLRELARIKVGHQYYGQHVLDQEPEGTDLLEAMRRHVRHKEHSKTSTIHISVFDRSPVIAASMADSTVARLQRHICVKKSNALAIYERQCDDECRRAYDNYERARRAYGEYADSHRDAVRDSVIKHIDYLQGESNRLYGYYRDATEKHLRARFLLQQSNPSFSVVKNATVPLSPVSPQRAAVYGVGLILGLILGWWLCLLRHRLEQRDFRWEWGGWFAPWTLTLLVWGAILTLIYIEGERLYPLTSQFYTSISLWLPILCGVSFVTFHLLPAVSARPRAEHHANMLIFDFFFLLTLVMTPLYAWQVYQVVSQFSAGDMLNNIRTLAVHGEGPGWLKYTVVINQALFLVGIWIYPRISRWKLAVIFLANVLCALAIMEKGAFFILAICSLFVMMERRVIRLRTMGLALVILVGVFFVFNDLRETTEARDSQMDFLEFFSVYITSPSVAFCTCVQDLSGQYGLNTFAVFYDFLVRFGVGNFVVFNEPQPFVMVPVVTNVYTVMQPFFMDFGYPGVAFFAVIYGLLSGVLFRYHRNGNAIARCLYTFLVQILVLQFYQEYILLRISGLVQLTLLVVLLSQSTITLKRTKNNSTFACSS